MKIFFCQQNFQQTVAYKIYQGSDILVELFKRSLDFVIPSIQIFAGKQPTYQRINKFAAFAQVLPGAIAILITTPLLGLGKLVQCAVMSRMYPHRLHRPQVAKFPLPFSQPGEARIKIGSLNVIGLPNAALRLGDKPNGDIAAKRLPLIAKALQKEDLDIVCLQESFDLKGSRALAREFKDRYILHHIGEQRPFCLGSGLMVVSKYPILSAHFVEYPVRLGIDKRAQKGIALVKVDLGQRDGKKIVGYVATTHTQANTKNLKQCAETRNLQLQLLQDSFEAFIKDTFLPNEEIKLKVVCGDLNFDNYRTARPHLDRHELNQPAIHRLFKKTLDPVVDKDAIAKPDNWVRPADLPGCGTALHWKNPRSKSTEELLEEMEGKATRRLDYTLFDQECHRHNQTIQSQAHLIRSSKGLILTDHLLLTAKVTYDPPQAARRISRCVHRPLLLSPSLQFNNGCHV